MPLKIFSGAFLGNFIFLLGLGFSVLVSYSVYRLSRSLILFIALSTALTFVFLFFPIRIICGMQLRYAEAYAIIGATLGFLASILFAVYVICFANSVEVQNLPQFADGDKKRPRLPDAKQAESIAKDHDDFFRKLRMFLYCCVIFLIFLFPPYCNSLKSSHMWAFFASKEIPNSYSFNLPFFFYEVFMLIFIFLEIEFWLKHTCDEEK